MKRTFALILSLLMVFCLAGCKDEAKKEDGGIDIAYYVGHGQVPEAEYKIGDSLEEMVDAMEKRAEEDHEYYYSVYESGNDLIVTDGATNYYFDNKKREKGVKSVARFDTSYGFLVGDLSAQIKENLEAQDIEYTERNLEEEEVEYISGAIHFSGIIVEIGKNRLTFALDRSQLCAVRIEKIQE